MEELVKDFMMWLWAGLGVMVFGLVLDVMVSRDKTGDAANGILRGKEADDFVAKAEEAVRKAKEEGRI